MPTEEKNSMSPQYNSGAKNGIYTPQSILSYILSLLYFKMKENES